MGKIFVDRGEIGRMARLFNVSYQTVRNALRGVTESELAERIRAEALKGGGVEKPRKVKILRVEV
jgi:DeoR/GlpR family transcriptional regulator of sugar metabolism